MQIIQIIRWLRGPQGGKDISEANALGGLRVAACHNSILADSVRL